MPRAAAGVQDGLGPGLCLDMLPRAAAVMARSGGPAGALQARALLAARLRTPNSGADAGRAAEIAVL